MAFLHNHTSECMTSELDIFSIPPTQTSIESSSYLHYKPVASLTDNSDAPIEFVVPSAGEHYLDLAHTMLYLQVKITPNHSLQENVKVGPVNNFLHSLFNQIDIFFNNKLVTPTSNAYAYRAYIETLLNYGPAAKDSHLTAGLWYDDEPLKFEALPDAPLADRNSGLSKRQAFSLHAQTFDMMGHLHCDIFNQDKMLINGVEMRVRLVRNKDAFCLMDSSENGIFKVQITEATLLVRRAKISPTVLLAHANGLAKTTAKYPITRVEVKSFTIHPNVLSECLDNVFLGQLPKRVIIGFIDNRSFNGHRHMNPFNFQHFNLNHISMYVDGSQVPSKALQPRFQDGQNKMFIDSFHTLFSGTGIHFLNEGISINRQNYDRGNFLTAFDITPDSSAHCASHWNLVRSGSVRIEVRFETAPTQTINCIVYAEFDNIVEIDADRQVISDFSA